MISNTLKLIFIFIGCMYIMNKSLDFSQAYKFTKKLCFCIATIILSCTLNTYLPETRYIIPLLLLWLIVSLSNHNPQISFVVTTISFGISFSLYSISCAIVVAFLLPYHNSILDFPYTLLSILAGTLQTIITISLFQFKRFRKGMPFLQKTSILNLATIICLISCNFLICMIFNYKNVGFQLTALFLFSFVFAFLIYWWQAQITKSYRRTLELRELESMRTEMAELKLKMQEVMEENEKLARITHRDNTLISTLKNSTVKYLMTDFTSSADAIATGEKLIANINALSAGRTSLPDNFNEKKARTFDTGVPLLDELLHQMDITAIENQITFSVHMGTILSDFVPTHVASDDLVHTVDDLLKNAFKATNTCDKRVVQLQFYKLGKHFVIEVADSGIPFEVKSLVNMGIERLTTYDDGSGIGLVDIWNTKTKYGATYHIDEYAVATPFSKKISLTFDKKNRYSIRTWRKNEITQMSKRADLQVYEDLE